MAMHLRENQYRGVSSVFTPTDQTIKTASVSECG
jgi:hypothetical protein